MLDGLPRWKIEVRYHADDSVADTYTPGGISRHAAEGLEKDIQQYLDHDEFYTEIVELPS